MRILRKLLKVPALLMLPLFSIMQWLGIFLTGLAGSIWPSSSLLLPGLRT